MALGKFFGKFFGRTIGDAASFAIGGSISRTIDPVLQEVENQAWTTSVKAGIFKPLEAGDAAGIVAEDVAELPWGKTQAAQTGIGADQFTKLYNEALNAPGLGQLFQMWRRGLITKVKFEHGLRKAKLEAQWDDPLEGLHDELLSSEELAMMQQQGFIPQSRANSEGLLQGVTNERQQLRFEASGLPPGIGEALDMLRRGIINPTEFGQIVKEGHTKTKYTDELLALRDQVLHATDYAGLRIRGWISAEESYAGGKLTGYSKEQMDQLFLNRGRPATTHQVWIGLQRGGTLGGPTTGIDPAFLKSVQQSDIRPEYANLLWAQRYTLPSAFVLRALVSDGTFTAAQGEGILLDEGWRPDLAKLAASKWAGAGSGGAKEATAANLRAEYEGQYITQAQLLDGLKALGYSDADALALAHLGDAARVKKYREAVITAVYKAYLAHELGADTAKARLSDVGVSGEAQNDIVALWNLELSVARRQLSPAQIAAAYRRQTIGEADALAELELRGYDDTEARILLGLALPQLTVKQITDALGSTISYNTAVSQLVTLGYNPSQISELLGPPPANRDSLDGT